MLKIIAMLILLSSVTACYRMPNDDEYSVVPHTNNPEVTRAKTATTIMPGSGF